jgi:hypothetical protein
MAINTYATLVTAIGNWLDDATLTDRIPEFIALNEAELSRVLRTPEMETVSTGVTVASTQTVALPTGLRQLRSLAIITDYNSKLQAVPLPVLLETFADQATGRPTHYALADENVYLGPTPDGVYTVQFLYRGGVTALTDVATTNWLLTSHPDAYLMGALLQAEFFGWNDNRLPLIKARFDEVLGQINQEAIRKGQGASIRIRHGVRGG